MRGISTELLFWIVALSAFIVIIYVLFAVPFADAVTRAEFDALKAQEKAAEDKIIELDKQLTVQRKLINDQTITVDKLKQELRQLDGNGDWESLRLKIEGELEITAADKVLLEYRDGLKSILREKSDAIKFLKSIDLDVPVQSNTNLSHLDKRIGVALSKACETMIRNNFESNCPTYKQLVQLDSSDTGISGKFTTDDDGFFHRGDEAVQDSYKFYWNDNTIRLFVDPPASQINRMKMIYIEPNFDTYTINGDMTVDNAYEIINAQKIISSGNQSRSIDYSFMNQTEFFGIVTYHDRYVDSRCREGTVNANDWQFLIGDTIHLMRNNCDRAFTGFEEREVRFPEIREIDLASSPEWQILQFWKHQAEFCIFKYKACT